MKMCFFLLMLITHVVFGEIPADEHEFFGTHFIASYLECDKAAILQEGALKEAFLKSAKASKANILNTCEHSFDGKGFTMVILLSESHVSIHTYPEHNACFVDLFTCGHSCSYTSFDEVLRDYLQPKESSVMVLKRTEEVSPISVGKQSYNSYNHVFHTP